MVDWLALNSALRRVGIAPPAWGENFEDFGERLEKDLRAIGIDPPKVGTRDEVWFPKLMADLAGAATRIGIGIDPKRIGK